MEFTKQELDLIVGLCDDSRFILDMIDRKAPWVKTRRARVEIAALSAKADDMMEAIDEKDAADKKKAEEIENAPAKDLE
jgi:hypothetical protein